MGIRCLDEWVDGRRRGSLHYAAMAGQAWTPRNPHRNVNINPFPHSCPRPPVLNPFLNLNPNPCPNPFKKPSRPCPGRQRPATGFSRTAASRYPGTATAARRCTLRRAGERRLPCARSSTIPPLGKRKGTQGKSKGRTGGLSVLPFTCFCAGVLRSICSIARNTRVRCRTTVAAAWP